VADQGAKACGVELDGMEDHEAVAWRSFYMLGSGRRTIVESEEAGGRGASLWHNFF
jgi:hypothetical protein